MVPLDAELNLPKERYSLELSRRVATEAAKSSFDETLEMIRNTTGIHVAKRQLEELTIRAARDFDTFYELCHARAYPNQDRGPILVISADGKGQVMRPEDLRDATRKPPRHSPERWAPDCPKARRKTPSAWLPWQRSTP